MEQTSGFLNINKPTNHTSHDIVAILRKSLDIKKIGHSGTLDPFATGVLIVGINEATKLFEYLPSDKAYLAEITFGIETDTDDITGKIIKKQNDVPTLNEITKKLELFKGKIKQTPPIYSAVKINGKRAYSLARKNNISLEDLKEREVEIYSIEIISYDLTGKSIKLKIHCSSGTYIRSIARDLGKSLNSCAVLSSLKRIKIGDFFSLEQSIDPKSLTKSNFLTYLIPPSKVISLEQIHLEQPQISDIFHGKSVKINEDQLRSTIVACCSKPPLRILDNNNDLIAIGTLTNNCIIKPKKVFLKNAEPTSIK